MAREIDEAWVEEAINRYRRIEALQAEFDAAVQKTEVSARSPDGLVEVSADANGAVRRVTIIGPLQGRSNVDLSRSIEAAIVAAAEAAEWTKRSLYAETFGGYPPLRGP
jgi:DNA-binding protein YbaB